MAISMLSMWDITFNQIKKKAPESTGIPPQLSEARLIY